jgi:PAT family beta-lactamase induction signal transducer AmpG
LWAPLVDRTSVPLLTAMFGHRRSWMLVSQAAIIIGLLLISGANPAVNLGLVAVFAVMVAFSSATQDIVIDAWRIEAAGEERQGAMAAAYQWGYRLAIIVAGVVPLLLASRIDWGFAYATMALLMAVGVAAVLLAPREKPRPAMVPLMPADMEVKPLPEAIEWGLRLALLLIGALLFGSGFTGKFMLINQGMTAIGVGELAKAIQAAWEARPYGVVTQILFVLIGGAAIVCAALPAPGRKTRPGVYFARSYGEPFKDFFTRFEGTAGLILAMICCYRLSDFVLNIMNPFYIDLGFSLDTIAEIRKVFGVIMMMIGVGLAGWAIVRFGLMASLLVGAFAGPVSNLVYIWLATQGASTQAFAISIAIENITAGFSGTVLIAYMSSLTSAGFTATQYALFSSLYALPGKLLAAQSGAIVEGGARMAHDGGLTAPLMGLFSQMPAGAFAQGAAKIGVAPAALGAGYVSFFVYSCAIGVLGLVLAVIIDQRRRQKGGAAPMAQNPTPAQAD